MIRYLFFFKQARWRQVTMFLAWWEGLFECMFFQYSNESGDFLSYSVSSLWIQITHSIQTSIQYKYIQTIPQQGCHPQCGLTPFTPYWLLCCLDTQVPIATVSICGGNVATMPMVIRTAWGVQHEVYSMRCTLNGQYKYIALTSYYSTWHM